MSLLAPEKNIPRPKTSVKGAMDFSEPLTRHKPLLKWIEKIAALTQPSAIHWVNGTPEEHDALCTRMVGMGTFTKLNEKLWPASGKETSLGWQPRYRDIDRTGCDVSESDFNRLQYVDRKSLLRELINHEEFFVDLHSHLPKELIFERELLICRLS